MSQKTGSKWGTPLCGRCGESHSGYSGKLDALGEEYVVCEVTNSRMDVSRFSPNVKYARLFPTEWIREDISIVVSDPK